MTFLHRRRIAAKCSLSADARAMQTTSGQLRSATMLAEEMSPTQVSTALYGNDVIKK